MFFFKFIKQDLATTDLLVVPTIVVCKIIVNGIHP